MSVSIDGAGSLIGVDQGLNIVGLTTLTGGIILDDSISHIGDTDTKIRFPAADTFTVETAGSERARVDSSGRLLLGTTTEGEANADDLTVATSAHTGMTIRSGTANRGNIYFSDGTSGDAEYRGYITYDHDGDKFSFGTANYTRIKILGDGTIASGNLSSTPGTVAAGSIIQTAANAGFFSDGYDGKFGTSSNHPTYLQVNGSSRLTVTTSGNVEVHNGASSTTSRISAHGFTCRDNWGGASGLGNGMSSPATNTLAFTTNSIERLRITSAGQLNLAGNMQFTAATPELEFNNGGPRFRVPAANTLTIHTGGGLGATSSEKLRIDVNGKMGLGTNSPGSYDGEANDFVVAGSDHTGITIASTGSNQRTNLYFADGTSGDTRYRGAFTYDHGNDYMEMRTAAVKRLRVTNNGRLDVFANSSTDAMFISSGFSAGTAAQFIKGMHSASSIGSGTASILIHTNGNIQNTNGSYGSISDIKLKENIVNANSQWDDIKSIQIRNFNFKEETGNPTHTQIGVIAQEIELVSPGLVYDTPDTDADGNDLGTVTKAVSTSVLYMKAVKALQEAQTRIETLETQLTGALARITALEGS